MNVAKEAVSKALSIAEPSSYAESKSMSAFHPLRPLGPSIIFAHVMSPTKHLIAALTGFVFSTVIAAVVASIGFAVVAIIGSADGCCRVGFDAETAKALLSTTFVDGPKIFGPFAAAGVVVFAGPLTLVLKRRRLERGWAYSISGFVIGYAIALVLLMPGAGAWPDGFTPGWWSLLGAILVSMTAFGVAGAAAGLAWWWAYRRPVGRGPDLSA